MYIFHFFRFNTFFRIPHSYPLGNNCVHTHSTCICRFSSSPPRFLTSNRERIAHIHTHTHMIFMMHLNFEFTYIYKVYKRMCKLVFMYYGHVEIYSMHIIPPGRSCIYEDCMYAHFEFENYNHSRRDEIPVELNLQVNPYSPPPLSWVE